ncbi:CinA family protein [Microbacterium sp. cf332]|uniref:CinA family protein n=1 Tax=Microbacterium sp. cf332 TaxID=1761804 RepID=UPI00088A22B2|nr:CinA family protein [Microbacterium sp. cf332]SDQ28307.1 nicotinamide-nucleotide amidase [Microbacterium sp. cf332]
MSDIEELARRAQRTDTVVAVAESLTAGNLAATIGAAEGAGEWFAGGVVAYRLETKHRVLGLAEGVDPCSAACAEQLARAVRDLTAADLAVSVTGVGGPAPQDGHDAGTVYLGWSDSDATGHILLKYDGEPEEVIDASVSAAVGLLLDRMPH